MKNDFGMLNGLFTTPVQPSRHDVSDENTKKSLITQRTWKIKDDLWDDFTALVKMSGLTQAEYVNKLIESDIEENLERLIKYREMFEI